MDHRDLFNLFLLQHTCLKPKSKCSCQNKEQSEHKEDCGRTVAAPKHFQQFDNEESPIYYETTQKKKQQCVNFSINYFHHRFFEHLMKIDQENRNLKKPIYKFHIF